MNSKPSGRLRGKDLVLTRTFRAPIAESGGTTTLEFVRHSINRGAVG